MVGCGLARVLKKSAALLGSWRDGVLGSLSVRLEKRQFLQDSPVISVEGDPASVSEECNCTKDLGRKAWDGNSGFLSSRTKEKWEK